MKKLMFLFTFLLFGLLFAEWTIVATYPITENASGLAWDGEYLYCGMYGANGDEVYRIDPSNGSSELLFTGTMDDTYGMTWDGEHLWITDHPGSSSNPAIAYQLDMSGNILQQVNLPDHYMSGIAYDDGNFWVSTYYDPDGYIYKIDSQGNILDEFAAPDNQPWDLCMENGFLWMADYWGDALYKIDPSDGSLIESHASEGVDPAGIVFDGNYIWYCDNGQGGNDYLYKVDLGGAGTPAIELGWDEYDFGNVVIDEAVNISLPITNNGTADLIISDFNSDQASFDLTENLPVTVTPGSTYNFGIVCYPQSWGQIDGTGEVVSNDPVNPSVTVSLSVYGIFAEQEIEYEPVALDYGTVRLNALTGRSIELSNQGAGDLSITGITIDNDLFHVEELDLPITIPTRDSVAIRIWLDANQTGDFTADLTIANNDADEGTLVISVDATISQESQDIGTEYWHFQTNVQGEKVTAMRKFTDINSDGYAEVIVCDNRYHVYCLNGASSGEADVLWRFDTNIDEIGYGSIYDDRGLGITDDLNEDGVLDVVIGTAWGSRCVFALDGTCGEIIWYYDTHLIGDGGWVYQVDGRRDFTGDGVSDILASAGDDGGGTGPRAIFLFNGTDGSVEWMQQFDTARASVSSIDDQNDDNIPDVICGGSSDGTDADFSLLSGANGSVIFTHDAGTTACWAVLDINDVTGDGIQDMVFGSFGGQLVCLDRDDTVHWIHLANGTITKLERAYHGSTEYVIPTMIGGNVCIAVNTDTGSATTWYSSNGNYLDCSPIGDIDGDMQFDILAGKLTNEALAVSSESSSLIWNTFMNQPVDRTRAVADLDANDSPEMMFGLRNGYVVCLSGGTSAGEPFATVTINVSTNSGFGTSMANYEFAGPETYAGDVPQDGVVVLEDVPFGIYDLTVTLIVHDDWIVENFEVTSDLEIDVLLHETLFPIEDFRSEVDGNTVTLEWGPIPTRNLKDRKEQQADRFLEGVRLYWEEAIIAELVEEESYYIVEDVPGGTHHFSAENIYTSGVSEPVTIEVTVLGTDDPGIEPYETVLLGNTPNPFNPSTTIRFSIKEDTPVTLNIYNLKGQKVRTLIDERMEKGEHAVTWHGDDDQGKPCSSGVYLYRMQAADNIETKKMIMMK